MKKRGEKKGVTVKIGNRKIVAYKDYERNEITAIERGKEVFHGKSHLYHRWVRQQRKKELE